MVSDGTVAVVFDDEWIEKGDVVNTSSIVVCVDETVSDDLVIETVVVSVVVYFRVSDVVGSSGLVVIVDKIVSDERVSVVIDDEKKE
jgi:hypothetical protein